uniref:cytochrome b n=1 Tax=Allonothrus sinicus TaxID=3138099 RepID=UPI00315D7CFB
MKKQETKTHFLMKMLNSSLIDLPSPSSISFLWNMGFLLGMTLSLQIITGLMVSMHYTAETSAAFSSVIHIMRDVEAGWITRFLHMNGASLFFILIYLHTARGIYFSSPPKKPMVWTSGIILMVMTMAAAFLGYVLPWGQMSFWGATVITNIFSAIPMIGKTLVEWLWGNFSVSQPTLNRFFSLHFVIPMAIAAMMLVHLIALHEGGSSNPTGTSTNMEKIKFHPMFMMKDITPMVWISLAMLLLISKKPDLLGDVENLNTANPLSTPVHIQPEWYFLFAYAILRSIPSKLGGVVALAMSIAILAILVSKKTLNTKFSPQKKTKMWILVSTVTILTWIGANPVEPPYEKIGQISSMAYFTSIITL